VPAIETKPGLCYFAYGSNMSRRRLCARTPSARVMGVATLHGHRLAFHKPGSRDGSAKCDIVEDFSATVFGVLYTVEVVDKVALDRIEGLGRGYAEKRVELVLRSGERVWGSTYVATLVDTTLRPFGWYKRHVLEGAREAGLPAAYIAAIEAVAAAEDPDAAREAGELAIYGPVRRGA